MKKLESEINRIAEEKNVSKAEIEKRLIAHLQTIYELNDTDVELKELMKVVGNKVLTTMYGWRDHRNIVPDQMDWKDVFGLDGYEVRVLKHVMKLLVGDGYVGESYLESHREYHLGLTQKGIKRARQL